jgi:hypothetical protein
MKIILDEFSLMQESVRKECFQEQKENKVFSFS